MEGPARRAFQLDPFSGEPLLDALGDPIPLDPAMTPPSLVTSLELGGIGLALLIGAAAWLLARK